MMILKEGHGWSDSELYENCRFNLITRKALGIYNLDDSIPVESTYYLLRKRIVEHQNKTGVDLFAEVFKQITEKQIIDLNVSGRSVRMDSKLIGSNIAFYTRYEIIHRTLCLFYKKSKKSLLSGASSQLKNTLAEITEEQSTKTVYTSSKEDIKKRLQVVGNIIYEIIDLIDGTDNKYFDTLKRIFEEQYRVIEKKIELRPKEEIKADSVQSHHDTDCAYRNKNDKPVKGYSHNITETCGDDQLNLITDVQVEKATIPDNDFVKPSLENTQEILKAGDKIKAVHADGAYNSQENQGYTKGEEIEFHITGIQGRQGRYDLDPTTDKLIILDRETNTEIEAIKLKSGSYRIETEKGYRYFKEKEIQTSILRKQIENMPVELANKRNNVEATIFQLSLHLRNNKTKYRGLLKNKAWAILRSLWINLCRIVKNVQEKLEKPTQKVKYALQTIWFVERLHLFNIIKLKITAQVA